jgi:CheY-specific phosphatase CheX
MELKKEAIGNAALQAGSETFAEMTFLDVLKDEEESSFTEGQLLYIEIYEPVKGRLIMALPTELKREIVENIHAIDWEELTVSDVDDCLLEVLNVYAGDFVRALFDSEAKVRLSFPSVMISFEEVNDLEAFYRFHFSAEGVPFCVYIHLEAEVTE